MQIKRILILFLVLITSEGLHAELTIRITQGVGKQTPVAIVPFGLSRDMPELFTDITEVI